MSLIARHLELVLGCRMGNVANKDLYAIVISLVLLVAAATSAIIATILPFTDLFSGIAGGSPILSPSLCFVT